MATDCSLSAVMLIQAAVSNTSMGKWVPCCSASRQERPSTFTKAAEQLGYSQSTVSFQIKQLEEELDCLLFERINHTITLTERGHDLVTYAHRIRVLTDEFKEGMAATEIAGHVHIVAPDSVCDDMIHSH